MARKKINPETSYFRRRSRTQYVTAMVSIAFVLLFLGIFATLALFTKTFANAARSKIALKVFLYDGVGEEQLQKLHDHLKQVPFAASSEFISKQKASEIFTERTGDNIMETMDGINPLLASIDVYLKEGYLNIDSLSLIKKQLLSRSIVADVDFPAEKVIAIGKNVNTLALISLMIGIVVVLLALYLVFGTIRLSIYAQRLTIRSMQLIGATHGFIRRPFIWRGLVQGFFAGILACIMLVVLLGILNLKLSLVDVKTNDFFNTYFVGILLGIVLFGSALGLLGSFLAVNKYLRQDLNELMG